MLPCHLSTVSVLLHKPIFILYHLCCCRWFGSQFFVVLNNSRERIRYVCELYCSEHFFNPIIYMHYSMFSPEQLFCSNRSITAYKCDPITYWQIIVLTLILIRIYEIWLDYIVSYCDVHVTNYYFLRLITVFHLFR